MNDNQSIRALLWGRSMRRTAYGIMDAYLRLKAFEQCQPADLNALLMSITNDLPTLSPIPRSPLGVAANNWHYNHAFEESFNYFGNDEQRLVIWNNPWDAIRLANLCHAALEYGIMVCRLEVEPQHDDRIVNAFASYSGINIIMAEHRNDIRPGAWCVQIKADREQNFNCIARKPNMWIENSGNLIY